MNPDFEAEFTAFFDSAERKLRQALGSAFGKEAGREATADSLAWAWQNWGRLRSMDNQIGYLYRVGRSLALKSLDPERDGSGNPPVATVELPDFEPSLGHYLGDLSENQRIAVWMVHGLGFPQTEVAELLGCSAASVATHVRRALAKLRHDLEVGTDG